MGENHQIEIRHFRHLSMGNSSGASSELGAYWSQLVRHGPIVVLFTLLTGATTFAVTYLFLTPYYRAMAMLRPNPPQEVSSRLNGALVSMPSLGSMIAGLGPALDTAEEDMEILQSYDFTTALVNQYHLRELVQGERSSRQVSDWWVYRQFSKRFECQYDRLSGALTLQFIDPNPAIARHVLELYIESLRGKLRQARVHSAAAARASLSDEAGRTSDPLLQNQLYEMIARQLEQEKIAEAETDFAFKTIQAPITPDKPFRPRVALDTVLACILASFVACFVIAVKAALGRRVPANEPTTLDPWRDGHAAEQQAASAGGGFA